ncbi:HAD hydrolase-like protein [Lacticaseibacillus zhaodongensis]|uniref:HAD hydrolase-like protein n=1 Tax=Lacticaseibacillus zhaodongensis TaxID=2668065 RepID=UPI0012D2A9A2|nr:HAD hydrolase-like protein [Lacticaseibacillus zhaodongensis]
MKTVIWDFDGTLFDTYPGMIKALQATLSDYGTQDSDAHALLLAIKIDSMKKVFDDYAREHQVDRKELQRVYNGYELELNADPKPYPGAGESLQAVHAAGGMNLLWTHRDQKAWRLLQRYGWKDLFAGGTTIDMHFKRKPDPESINFLLNKFNLQAADTLVVGDRYLDVAAGTAAGCNTLYLNVDGLNAAPAATWHADSLLEAEPLVRAFVTEQFKK